jgi:hypothetical protein
MINITNVPNTHHLAGRLSIPQYLSCATPIPASNGSSRNNNGTILIICKIVPLLYSSNG